MAKNKESLIDVCIRILRKADASEESKDLAEVVLRAEVDKPVQRVTEYIYHDRYYRRPWYNDYQVWCASNRSQAVGKAFGASLCAANASDSNVKALAAALSGHD